MIKNVCMHAYSLFQTDLQLNHWQTICLTRIKLIFSKLYQVTRIRGTLYAYMYTNIHKNRKDQVQWVLKDYSHDFGQN